MNLGVCFAEKSTRATAQLRSIAEGLVPQSQGHRDQSQSIAVGVAAHSIDAICDSRNFSPGATSNSGPRAAAPAQTSAFMRDLSSASGCTARRTPSVLRCVVARTS